MADRSSNASPWSQRTLQSCSTKQSSNLSSFKKNLAETGAEFPESLEGEGEEVDAKRAKNVPGLAIPDDPERARRLDEDERDEEEELSHTLAELEGLLSLKQREADERDMDDNAHGPSDGGVGAGVGGATVGGIVVVAYGTGAATRSRSRDRDRPPAELNSAAGRSGYGADSCGRGGNTMDDAPVLYKIYDGKVSGMKNFGAFTTLEGVRSKAEGMLHTGSIQVGGARTNHPNESPTSLLRLSLCLSPRKDYPTFDDDADLLNCEDAEEELDIEFPEEELLLTKQSVQLFPIKIVQNPDGSINRAALAASALAKERREIR
ncbi:hypothetical protein BDK51DRAFT_30333 [Blyttiomyces helicus]|uniref:Uncharacterized protein n=1 Tax=Blyttiomyces helicus TaxID=388810 RepID=A0A4P9WKQ7_9FUNG|nr:hypothetical protein BDK51DRAFT_30333 [Blyttiomyces helicus]|eukprot:RKO93589.1 hypothetical protein BDK51DRAFT_30333 [Blyttiomyces helicus]